MFMKSYVVKVTNPLKTSVVGSSNLSMMVSQSHMLSKLRPNPLKTSVVGSSNLSMMVSQSHMFSKLCPNPLKTSVIRSSNRSMMVTQNHMLSKLRPNPLKNICCRILKSINDGNTKRLNKLLGRRSGASSKFTNDDMSFSLITAVKQGKEEIVTTLLSAGANPNCEDEDGKTPLFILLESGKIQFGVEVCKGMGRKKL